MRESARLWYDAHYDETIDPARRFRHGTGNG